MTGSDERPGRAVSTVLSVRSAPVTDGETAYVYAGGVVEAVGGRVVVGSGGLCLSSGDARVSLVDDSRGLLTPWEPPIAVMVRGSLAADGGRAWARTGVPCDLTGTAQLVPLAVPGRPEGDAAAIHDGRRVQIQPVVDRPAEEVWAELVASRKEAPGPRRHLDPEPHDVDLWVRPLTEELDALGARVSSTSTSRVGTDLLARSRDPRRTLAGLLARIGVPPTLVVDQDSRGDWWLLSDHGLRVRFTRGGRFGGRPVLRA